MATLIPSPAQGETQMTGHHVEHEVFNQPPPLVGYDLFAQDAALREGVQREGADWAMKTLHEIGQRAGSAEALQWGFDANACTPTLNTYDRYGHRIDEVTFHPAWHELMARATGWGLHASSWREARPGAHVARIVGFYLWSQVEAGHGCPISMTHAAIPALRAQPELAAEWEPYFTALRYDPTLRPVAEKGSALCGMGMTEKQGGSDVRANITRAEAVGAGGPGGEYLLTGHKWFCSAPMCDAFLMLAQAPGGLSCFLVPRILPNGARNRIYIQRLKDKLGNRSNASSEIELDHAWARLIGEEGRGVKVIVEMVNSTRLDCVAGSAALMRQAAAQATHHAAYRAAFGRTLIDQPLMQNVLADLAIESEAATLLMLRLARASDEAAAGDAQAAAFKRIGVAIGKYWVCKRTPTLVAEALECLGGNGYVEESGMPRLYREAPVNSIWEGSGNVICLDTLRALAREPETSEAYFAEVAQAHGANVRLDTATTALQRDLRALAHPDAQTTLEWQARHLVERMALVLQASLLARHSPQAVADAFCVARLGDGGRLTYGDLPIGIDATAIIARARPQASQ
ncbi:MAG TPA: isovaleryl-CoA dehydrogenase [Ktedonobacterales bacterium]|nr:isovaleryl-CoA dehydrogenase [Ktedonobacterales bacterium]